MSYFISCYPSVVQTMHMLISNIPVFDHLFVKTGEVSEDVASPGSGNGENIRGKSNTQCLSTFLILLSRSEDLFVFEALLLVL